MSSGESTTCPLCQAVVESGDALQLHYLTNCSGYDKGKLFIVFVFEGHVIVCGYMPSYVGIPYQICRSVYILAQFVLNAVRGSV